MNIAPKQDAPVGGVQDQLTQAEVQPTIETKIVIPLSELNPHQAGEECESIFEKVWSNLSGHELDEVLDELKELAPDKELGLLMQQSKHCGILGIADELYSSLDAPYSYHEVINRAEQFAVATAYIFPDGSTLLVGNNELKDTHVSHFYQKWRCEEYRAAKAEANRESEVSA